MYPLKFQPVFQRRLWGGQRLRTILHKSMGAGVDSGKMPMPHALPIGESWELADLPPGTVQADSTGAAVDGALSSVIANGPWAGRTLHNVWGEFQERRKTKDERRKGGGGEGYFPLLVKFLDAQQDLSVQVHPDEAYCGSHPGAHLKSEAWFILHAEAGARIFKGVKPGTSREEFRAALEAGRVEPLLNEVKVQAGDCHYLPSGTVHALGAGILAAEVQTPSDTTFRVFDWNRLTAEGKPRQLHVAEALACMSFAPPPEGTRATPESINNLRLVECEFFTLDRRGFPAGRTEALAEGEMSVWIVLGGQGVITCEAPGAGATTALARGDVVLLPATMREAKLRTIANLTLLEARMPANREVP
jgi:mannose-6-phosphate isomerase